MVFYSKYYLPGFYKDETTMTDYDINKNDQNSLGVLPKIIGNTFENKHLISDT